MKKHLAPLLATSLMASACFPFISTSSSYTSNLSNLKGSDCTTRRCFIKEVFDAKKTGEQPDGSVLVCRKKEMSPAAILRKARKRYAKINDCEDLDSRMPMSLEQVGIQQNNDFAISCARVNYFKDSCEDWDE